ncbi:ankyrin repeat domain-containing protein [Rickettsiales endosymbiont of Stachyamoeba lipophora]|uniref:ankyrin repeat domain-containing protein n=1 Tax=Rickettsiales endosymbiont of Stachyamoeba lipophora TaxID=2486578 RepID=UPI000F648E67|nr:ankyrin repeat domain-containing protein [Rickettsiales endosymbiont of Stachyamoeba lipophora]AZL15017.1 ankyrin repeat domain-containing protein [Rickettsiales endosymbiont of Stachyamoeba lipophora]
MFSFANILAQSQNQQIICDFINDNASGIPLEDVIALINTLSEAEAKTLLEYLFYLQWEITKQAEIHRLALIRALLNNPHAQNLIKALNIIEPEVPAQDAIAEDTIKVVAGKNPQQQFKHISNQYSVLLKATEVNNTDFTWTLLTNLELIKLSDIAQGTIDIAKLKLFLTNPSTDATLNDRSQKIAQFITIIKNQLPKNATAIELAKLLPLALEHTPTDIAQMLINNYHDVNLSLDAVRWIDDNKKEQHSLTSANPIINTVINIVEAQNDINVLSNQLYILQALLLNPKANLNLYYTEDENEAILVSEYVAEHLSDVLIKTQDVNTKLQLLHLIPSNKISLTPLPQALDKAQLEQLINELVATFETTANDYQLTSKQQSTLQALYDICRLKEPKLKLKLKLKLTDLIDENYFEQHSNLSAEQKAELKNKLHHNKIKLEGANQNLLEIINSDHFSDTIIKFIQQGADVNAKVVAYPSQTALHIAAQRGHTETARILVQELTADVNATDLYGNTALHYAAENGHTETVRVLVQELGADVEAIDKYGNTVLHFTAENGHTETVRVLVQDLGANATATNNNGQTALHYAAEREHTGTVQILAQLGTDVEAIDKDGKTALHYAAERGHTETVRVLVQELSADIAATDTNGKTALHYAAQHRHTETVRILVQLGANVNTQALYGKTALHYAAVCGPTETVRVLVQELKADVNATDEDGRTALHYAATVGQTETIRILKELGADVNAKDKDGKTALHIAAECGHIKTVRVLVQELGADIAAKDDDDKTALHYAAEYGHAETVQVLAQLGANVNATDNNGKTALDLVKQAGYKNPEIEKLLTEAMAKQKDNNSITESTNANFHQQAIKQRRLSQDNQRGIN